MKADGFLSGFAEKTEYILKLQKIWYPINETIDNEGEQNHVKAGNEGTGFYVE